MPSGMLRGILTDDVFILLVRKVWTCARLSFWPPQSNFVCVCVCCRRRVGCAGTRGSACCFFFFTRFSILLSQRATSLVNRRHPFPVPTVSRLRRAADDVMNICPLSKKTSLISCRFVSIWITDSVTSDGSSPKTVSSSSPLLARDSLILHCFS